MYILNTILLHYGARTDPRLLRAQQLYWMAKQHEPVIGLREIVQFGPGPLRAKASADEARSILKSHGWIAEVSGRPRRVRLVSEEPSS